MSPCLADSRSLFEKLQQAEGLDLRDNRGKRHDLAVVLVGVVLALLSKRDGCLSSIHRYLVNHYARLVEVLGVERKTAISRAQLPRVLEKVAGAVLDELLLAHARDGVTGRGKEMVCAGWQRIERESGGGRDARRGGGTSAGARRPKLSGPSLL